MSFLTLWKNRSSSEKIHNQSLGKTVGIVWEYPSFHSGSPGCCIVQIKKEPNSVTVTIYDPNDRKTTSVGNVFEDIATGIYLEHFSEYHPEDILFYHRDAIGTGTPKW